ncbi:MAG TPA: hypothetical protein VGO86_15995 [Candidatus Dormibacteraeota bacterium]|jgi:hypothetical protein
MQNNEETPAVVRPPAGARRGRRLADEAERLARSGLGIVKARARRDDTVGQVTHRALELVSGGLGVAGKTLSKLGETTEPPVRGTAARPPAPAETPGKRAARTRPDSAPRAD